MKTVLIALGLFALISACSPKISPDKYWSDKRWILTELKEVPVQQSGTRRDAYIEFNEAAKTFSGNGGCNQINGNYSLDNKELRFTEVRSTKMSCADIEFETIFLELLNDADRFEMDDNALVLKDGRKEVLKFRAR